MLWSFRCIARYANEVFPTGILLKHLVHYDDKTLHLKGHQHEKMEYSECASYQDIHNACRIFNSETRMCNVRCNGIKCIFKVDSCSKVVPSGVSQYGVTGREKK